MRLMFSHALSDFEVQIQLYTLKDVKHYEPVKEDTLYCVDLNMYDFSDPKWWY